MSKGLYGGISSAADSREDANLAVVRMITEEMKFSSSLAGLSRAVIDKVHGLVKTKYKESAGDRMDCSSVDDTTLLIRNLGFPFEHSETIPRSLAMVPPVSVPQLKEDVVQEAPEVSDAYVSL